MTDEEHTTFMFGFDLSRPPGPDEADALDRAEEVVSAEPGKLRVAVPRALAKAILAVVEPLPENLAAAAWLGFLRSMIAQASGAPEHVHESGRA